LTLAQALQNMAWMLVPAAIYAAVVRWRAKLTLNEIAQRLGLTKGTGRWYLVALVAVLPFIPLVIWVSQWTSAFKGSTIAPFVGQSPSLTMIAGAINYGLIATGFPEELLFRGLIGGALFRRLSFWKANLIQAVIFMGPHLLLLLVAPDLWPLAIAFPLALGLLAGWLRHTSGSIGPAVILHAVPNIAGALAVLSWKG
jgi:membrane protease YdiL (CAAX protease family)